MHNHDGKNSKSMMWMIIPCLILLGVLFFAGGKLSSGYLWPILIGVFVVAHVWMMFRGHGGRNDTDTEDKIGEGATKQAEKKDGNSEHKGGGCCH
ncbi:MAG: hypothetical protein AAB687_00665 [Patescibacteria group bacterium]